MLLANVRAFCECGGLAGSLSGVARDEAGSRLVLQPLSVRVSLARCLSLPEPGALGAVQGRAKTILRLCQTALRSPCQRQAAAAMV
eukprot:352204-Chlamydomonas_euryale.AAC.5